MNLKCDPILGTLRKSDGAVGTDTSDATAVAGDILNGKTAYGADGKLTGTLVPLDTSDANATAENILSGKTAYVNGKKVTGTISSYTGSSLIIPGVADKVISNADGIYIPKAVKVAGESELLAENIKKGVSIYGIVGTLESAGGSSEEYYKCASVSSGGDAVVEGRLMTMSFIDVVDFNYNTEPTVIHFTIADTTKTGLEREWVSSDGVYTFKKYVNTMEGYISWGLYKNSDNSYSVTLKKWIFYGKLWQKCILRPNLLLLDTMNENVGTWDFYIALTDLFQKIPA